MIDTVLMPPVPYTGIGICYNTITHTIVAGSTYEECNAYMYVVDWEMGGQTYTGCYNTISHALSDVTQEICESYIWTPPVDIPNFSICNRNSYFLSCSFDSSRFSIYIASRRSFHCVCSY